MSATISYEVSANDFGDAQLLIMNYDGDVIHKSTCNVKQTYQLAQLNNNPLGFWTGVIGTATGAAASAVAQNPAGVITSITSGIASNMENLYPKEYLSRFVMISKRVPFFCNLQQKDNQLFMFLICSTFWRQRGDWRG